MPQPPVGMTLTGKGDLSVKRNCAVCGAVIDAPQRFCVPHLLGRPMGEEVPLVLKRQLNEAGPNVPIDHPAVQAIVDWWSELAVRGDA